VGEFLYAAVAGIDFEGPGFARIVIRPVPGGGLTHAKASYASIRGKISSSWKIENGRFRLEVTIPPNGTALVHVPAADAAAVTEGGGPAAKAPGVKFLRAEAGAAIYEVGSGSYLFGSTLPK
jgi:alpha-L-rhamnosidase